MACTFEQVLEKLDGPLRKIARWRSNNHPFFGRDDLYQVGMEAIWKVWLKHKRKNLTEVCRIGFAAANYRMKGQVMRAIARGEAFGNAVDIDPDFLLALPSLVTADGHSNKPHDQKDYPGDAFLELALREVGKTLSNVGRVVLVQLMRPSKRTQSEFQRQWFKRNRKSQTWSAVEPRIYAESLGLPVEVIRGALSDIRWKIKLYVADHGIIRVERGTYTLKKHTSKKEGEMDEKDFVVDPMDLDPELPGEETKPEKKKSAPAETGEDMLDLDAGEETPEAEDEGFGELEAGAKEETPRAKPAKKEKPVKAAKPEKKKAAKPKPKPKAKPKPKPKAKPKKKGKVRRAAAAATATKIGPGFREGSQGARVFALLDKKLSAGKNITLLDITKAHQKALNFAAETAAGVSRQFAFYLIRKGLVTRVGRGEFTKS